MAVNEGAGKLHPIIIPLSGKNRISLMNPSIYRSYDNFLINLRVTNYVMNHSEEGKFPTWGGPLQYMHSEKDVKLRTDNVLVLTDKDFNIIEIRPCVMTQGEPENWDFVGLEDARIVSWEHFVDNGVEVDSNLVRMCGVRRDVTNDGKGRMELCEFKLERDEARELWRLRLPVSGESDPYAPYNSNEGFSYCEKNWMPILCQPWRFVSWCNPTKITELAKVDGRCVTTVTEIGKSIDCPYGEIRGGSQVIPYNDYYIAFVHSCSVWKPYSGDKDAIYHQHVIIWDKDFNLIKISKPFSFIDSKIEFCCGLCSSAGHKRMYVSFSEMDNTAFVLEFDSEWLINTILKEDETV